MGDKRAGDRRVRLDPLSLRRTSAFQRIDLDRSTEQGHRRLSTAEFLVNQPTPGGQPLCSASIMPATRIMKESRSPSSSSSSDQEIGSSFACSEDTSTEPTSVDSRSESPKNSSLSQLPPIPDANIPDKVDKADGNTRDNWVRRDARMIRLTGKHPFNSEARLDELYAAGFLTPTSLFFVRNHGAVPKIDVDKAANWRVRFHGLFERNSGELELGIAELSRICRVVTLPVTLVCAGNRRKEQNVVNKGLGFNWGAAGVSTALFTGIYLADLLAYLKPIRGRAKHVIFEGADSDLPNGPYGTSQRLSWAASHEQGMLLAWKMNGTVLEPDHGFPIRLVVPGQIGGRSVKWLMNVEISANESQHYLHFWDNKVLPTQVTAQRARDESHWWYDPKYIINNLNVNSAIAKPNHEEIFPVTTTEYTIQGYAYAGGGRRVTRVELSFDQGENWELAKIVYPEDLYRAVVQEDESLGLLDLTERDTCFCWCFWSYKVETKRLVSSDAVTVRAMDQSLALQQRDMYWNATGMMNNWWFRVVIHRENQDGKDVLRFEHPTLAGVAAGGWMERLKAAGMDITKPKFGNVTANTVSLPEPTSGVSMVNPDVKRAISWVEYNEATTKRGNKKPLFIVDGECYDGTDFLEKHPGGADSIWLAAGERDATEDFVAIHSDDARKKMLQFHIGTMEESTESRKPLEDEEDSADTAFLHKRKWKLAKLASITPASHDSATFRFELPDPDMPLGLPVGQHVFVRLRKKDTGEMIQRAYTPVSLQNARGHIDLLVKMYLPCESYPTGGKMSTGFNALEIGDTIEFKGPLGSLVWRNPHIYHKEIPRERIRRLGLVCAGSGITPILQVLRRALDDFDHCDKGGTDPLHSVRELWLLDANKTEADILCREELDTALRRHESSGRLRVHYTLGRAPAGWTGSSGRITEDMMQKHLPPAPASKDEDAMVLLCGPEGLVHDTVLPGLKNLGWNIETSVVVF